MAPTKCSAVWMLAALLGSAGCKSRQQQTNAAAIEQAKLMAAQTNGAMRVVTVDAAGNAMQTVVQPPTPGAKSQQVSTQTLSQSPSTPPAARLPVLPVITPADQPVTPTQSQ